jgi:hypothetical protein
MGQAGLSHETVPARTWPIKTPLNRPILPTLNRVTKKTAINRPIWPFSRSLCLTTALPYATKRPWQEGGGPSSELGRLRLDHRKKELMD